MLGARFIAGLTSRAFDTSVTEPGGRIEAGLDLIPTDSAYARVVRAVRDHHKQAPDDWRSAYQLLTRDFGYDRYGGVVHVIPNAGRAALALLYSDGDFDRGVQIATNAPGPGAPTATPVTSARSWAWRSDCPELARTGGPS